MPTEDDDLTLTNILYLAKQSRSDYKDYLKDADDRLKEIDDIMLEIGELKKSNEDSIDGVTELMKYKSSLLQIKSKIESEKKSMKKEMSTMDDIIGAVEKAIKWNTGDIF